MAPSRAIGEYQLGDGVRTRQVTFFVDGGAPLYGKLFLPTGFTTTGSYPAVVVGHGINARSIGVEKFASRFAERRIVAMAIDYQSYGFSGSGSDDIRLLEPDMTSDAAAVTEGERRILLFSEAVPLHGRLFVPSGFNTNGAAAAVVLAPDWGETAASIEGHAAQFAAKGIVAMGIDYRSWGKCGGFNSRRLHHLTH